MISASRAAIKKEPRDIGKKNPGKTYLPRFLDKTDVDSLKDSVERELADISMYMEKERQVTSKIVPGSEYKGTWDACTDKYPEAEVNSTWDVVVTCGNSHVFDGKTWEAGHQLIYLSASKRYVQRTNPGTDGIKHIIDLIQVEVDNAKAKIEENKIAIAETNFALSQLSVELKAEVAKNTAAILKVDEVVADLSGVVATNKTELTAAYKAGDADVTNKTDAKLTIVNQTIADNKQAAAQATTDLRSEMNGNVANINQTLSTVSGKVTTAEGEIDVLQSKWTVQADVNGKISGIEMVNNGRKSAFNILADQFTVTDGSTVKPPFRIENQKVSMSDVIVRGQIEAASGTFNGTVNAQDGVFKGDITGSRGTFTGSINIQDQSGNVGMKLTNKRMTVYDAAGRVRFQVGDLT